MFLSVVAVIVVHCVNSALLSSFIVVVVVVVVVKVFVSYITHSHGECHGLEKVVKYVGA
jgi:hypothetical protein